MDLFLKHSAYKWILMQGICVQVSKWCIVFAGIGAGAIVMGMLQQYGFGCMGQRLTRRLRVLLFRSMFRQVCALSKFGHLLG